MFNRIPSSLKNLFVSLVLVALLFGGNAVNVFAQTGATGSWDETPAAVEGATEVSQNPSSGGYLKTPTDGSISGCSIIPFEIFTTDCISSALSYISTVFTGWLVVTAAFFLDMSTYFALDGATYNNQGIDAAWQVLRDVTNIIFIFLILYVGIQTILGLSTSNTRKTLVRIIMVALLINFSLVITGIIIDASNVLALSFYDAFPSTNCVTGNDLGSSRSLSCPFAQGAGLNEFMGGDTFNKWVETAGWGEKAGATIGFFILRMVVNIIAAFVLFTAAVLFMIRTGMLLFLMVIAPLAAAAWAIPNTEKYAKDWFGKLLNNAFFAPIFLLLYYVSARMYLSEFYTSGFDRVDNFSPITSGIMKFVITVTFLVAAIIVSKKLGASGAKYFEGKMKDYGKKYSGAVGQQTIGRASTAIKDSDTMKKFVARNPRLIGNMALSTLTAGSKATFGGEKGGFAKRQEESIKRNADNLKYVGKDKRGNDLIASEREIIEEEWVDTNGKPVSRDFPGAREVLRNSAGEFITREKRRDGSTIWRDSKDKEMKDSPLYSLANQTSGFSQKNRTIKEQTRASDIFAEKIARQRKKPFASGFKRSGEGVFGGEKPTEVTIVAEKRDDKGNITQREVRGTVGGRQTTVDRESTLKSMKDKKKSDWEKAYEKMKKEVADEESAKKDQNEGGKPATA
jgi:hypothetical protein